MADPTEAGGRIVTFYSFKGGVGRTMALANVAFLAAANGKRVLVMDWDLEAPGLAYYFRGMQEGAGARAIKSAPGVMDIVWNWSRRIREAESVQEVEALVELHREGTPFAEAARPLIPDFEQVITDDDEASYSARLDIIGAGSPALGGVTDLVSYEDALSRFDWRAFFDDEAGGLLLTSLREWAKRTYDFILIDSRTGFADVAGICTMQLPDEVALCFIYNRQNIDGVATVSCAIRKQRGAEVELHAIPMRTSQENTTEEASARARARKELARRGGFGLEAVEEDLQRLPVRQAPNVPFFETIAQVASHRQRADQLTLDYFNLASELIRSDLRIPDLDEEWISGVRRRLQPRLGTADYVVKLKSDDPERAYQEVYQLIEGAHEDLLDGEPDDEYLRALIELSIQVSAQIGPFDSGELLNLTLELVRALADLDPEEWRASLANLIETYLERAAFLLDDDEELLLLDEADQILGSLPGDALVARRIANRRRAARIHLAEDRIDAASQLLSEFLSLAADLRKTNVTPEVQVELDIAELDSSLLKGDIRLSQEKRARATQAYREGIKFSSEHNLESRPEFARIRFELFTRLAFMDDEFVGRREAAEFALLAVETRPSSNVILLHFSALCMVIAQSGRRDLVVRFIQRALIESDIRAGQLASFFGRTEATTSGFIAAFEAVIPFIDGEDADEITCRRTLLSVLRQSMQHTLRRPMYRRRPPTPRLEEALKSLRVCLAQHAVHEAEETFQQIEQFAREAELRTATRRKPV
jgi:hypothetical protein